jgi:cold shock CspA family protein
MIYFGTLRAWIGERGFGFLKLDHDNEHPDVNNTRDVFCHIKDFQASGISEPIIGQRYTFTVETDKRSGRFRATNLKAA